MLAGLLGPSSDDNQMLDLFSDESLINQALSFEAALSLACVDAGLIDGQTATLVTQTIENLAWSRADLVSEAHFSGTLAIPVVQRIKQQVAEHSTEAVAAVHLGSTSQDLSDTILSLQGHAANRLIQVHGSRLCEQLIALGETHVATPAMGRTLMRGATPITFGLRVTNWLNPLASALRRLDEDCRALPLQLGGAVGTNTGLGEHADLVRRKLAARLDLPAAEPWHTNRTCTANVASGLGLLGGALAKIAGDTVLLGQDEIGELYESNPHGRGGSSAMAHKNNPVNAQQCLLAAKRLPALQQQVYAALDQELERSLVGWQSELPVLAEMFCWAYDALLHASALITQLQVDQTAMLKNIASPLESGVLDEAQALTRRAIADYRSHSGTKND